MGSPTLEQKKAIADIIAFAVANHADKTADQIFTIIIPEIDKALGGKENEIVLYPVDGIKKAIQKKLDERLEEFLCLM
jgi:hypothetical protein